MTGKDLRHVERVDASREQPRGEVLQARLVETIEDLVAGRITATEANRISREVGAELRLVQTAMRAATTYSKQRRGTTGR
jgi:hypothetical protein